MSETSISAVLNITPRYLRSTNIERDFRDSRALKNYILTPHAHQCLTRLGHGLHRNATGRAWRLTGNYGSGKSSFALMLAHWFSGNTRLLRSTLGDSLRYEHFGISFKPHYLPVLVTGSREPMGRSILRALVRVMDEQYTRGSRSTLVSAIGTAAEKGLGFTDSDVIEWIVQCNTKLIKDGRSTGMLILLDELGKFLEFAAIHPQQQDVYLLQKLGEVAAVSGAQPLFLVGLLHQSFDAYADHLDQATQREWEKISGRFEEIVFSQPLAQISQLISAALGVQERLVPLTSREEMRAGMDATLKLGWMGATPMHADLMKSASKLFPLHPTVLPALVRTFGTFGQNERSLFSFLLSHEPFGLQDFASRPLELGNTYRLTDFYDYVRANFRHKLSVQSYRSHWNEIDAMVESFTTSDPTQLKLVKTVGILNLLGEADLAPTDKAMEAALGGPGGLSTKQIHSALENLHKTRRVLYRRGVSGSYCLWSHTSVDLEAALEKATKAIGPMTRVGNVLKDALETRPIVARRHYIQTGNLRYFDVRYCQVDEIEQLVLQHTDADGVIAVALCETNADCSTAERIARGKVVSASNSTLLAIPCDPLINHAGLAADALRWDWVALNTPELNGDRFAREEVFRQKKAARLKLERRIQDLLGLRSLGGGMALRWFQAGAPVPILSARCLLTHVSRICDDLYGQAPHIHNELVNRRNLSSAAAAARMRLIERIFNSPNKPLLGMDPLKKPPEMSIYLSILKAARIHRDTGGQWQLAEPNDPHSDPCRMRFAFQAIRAFLDAKGDARAKVSELLRHMGQPPLGIRMGLAPLFLAVYSAIHSDEVAFYEDNTFLPEVGGDEFMRMTKAPETFDIQLCRVAGLRAEVFESLISALDIASRKEGTARLLDVVRPLCQFVARLPDYSRNTRRLSARTLAVRDAILNAKEPVKLLFNDLPRACQLSPFPLTKASSSAAAKAFAVRLRASHHELRNAFPALLDRMRRHVQEDFSMTGSFAHVRECLASRAKPLVVIAAEPKLKAFCMRLVDHALAEDAWIESLGSLLVRQPPNVWHDTAEDSFSHEFSRHAMSFRNLESIAFKKGGQRWDEAFRVALTREDGTEAEEVVYIEKHEREEVSRLAAKLQAVLGRKSRVGMAALSRVAWQQLGKV